MEPHNDIREEYNAQHVGEMQGTEERLGSDVHSIFE
jgi:hypothetical protein